MILVCEYLCIYWCMWEDTVMCITVCVQWCVILSTPSWNMSVSLSFCTIISTWRPIPEPPTSPTPLFACSCALFFLPCPHTSTDMLIHKPHTHAHTETNTNHTHMHTQRQPPARLEAKYEEALFITLQVILTLDMKWNWMIYESHYFDCECGAHLKEISAHMFVFVV